MSFEPEAFDWIAALRQFGTVTLVGIVLALLLLAVASVFRGGTGGGAGRMFGQSLADLVRLSPTRIFALAQLTVRESLRKWTLLVFVVFGVLFMFASWFLRDAGLPSEMQIKVQVSTVLRAISWLTVPVMLLLACWGLPQDIKVRSLHTVVTKPARRSEVFLGRFLGYAAVGTLILVLMSVAGWAWIRRTVPPSAREALVARVPIYGELSFTDTTGAPAEEGVNVGDIWEFRSYIAGASQASAVWDFTGVTPAVMVVPTEAEATDATDEATAADEEDAGPSRVLQLEAHFESFRTHKGNIGESLMAEMTLERNLREWAADYLSQGSASEDVAGMVRQGDFRQVALEFARQANGLQSGDLKLTAAEFQQIALGQAAFSDLMLPFVDHDVGFPADQIADAAGDAYVAAAEYDAEALAAAFERLREYLRDHQQALAEHLTDLEVVWPERGFFDVVEYRGNTIEVPRELFTAEGQPVDLFEDLVHGTRLRVRVRCLNPGQYLGMARPDLFIRTPDRPFEVSYFKAIGSIWLMVVLVVLFGVTASTFLKGPVATLLTATLLIVGTGFHPMMEKFFSDDPVVQKRLGSTGALESIKRIIRHDNPYVELEEGFGQQVIEAVDTGLQGYLWVVYQFVPNFNVFALSAYPANGFDIPWIPELLRALTMTISYFIPCYLLAYIALRFRELEAK